MTSPYRAPAPAPPPAPLHLHETPPTRRLPETFGWFGSAALLGAGLFVGGLFALSARGNANLSGLLIEGAVITAAIAAAVLEGTRRRRRVALALYDDRLAVYRAGQLDTVVLPGQLRQYVVREANTVAQVFGLVFLCGFFGIAGTTVGFATGMDGVFAMGLGALVFGVAGGLSSVYLRSACVTFDVPTQRGVERIRLRARTAHAVALEVRWFSVVGSI